MRRMITGLLLVLIGSMMTAWATSSSAAVTSETVWIVKEVKDGSNRLRLHAMVRFHGIEKGEVFKYSFTWTAPDVFYEHKDGSKTRLFRKEETYTPEKPAGDTICEKCRPYCADTKERGCWRTTAYRTVETIIGDGSKVRGLGLWTLVIKREDTGEAIGRAVFNVMESTVPSLGADEFDDPWKYVEKLEKVGKE